MSEFLEILKYILPSLIVLATAYYILRSFLDNELKKYVLESKTSNNKLIVPVRLQAYERIVLFLERISPNNLVMRVNKPGLNAGQFQGLLINSIRDEFDHNLSQQLYVSSGAWELVKTAKEEVISVINTAAAQMNENSTGNDLAKKILEISIEKKSFPVYAAIEHVKKEIQQEF